MADVGCVVGLYAGTPGSIGVEAVGHVLKNSRWLHGPNSLSDRIDRISVQ